MVQNKTSWTWCSTVPTFQATAGSMWKLLQGQGFVMLLCPVKMPAEKPLLISKVIEIQKQETRNKRETLTGKQGAKDFQAILSPMPNLPALPGFVCLFVCFRKQGIQWRIFRPFFLGSQPPMEMPLPPSPSPSLSLFLPIFLPYQVFCCIVKVALGRRQVVHKTSHHVTTENDFYLQGMKLLKQDMQPTTKADCCAYILMVHKI